MLRGNISPAILAVWLIPALAQTPPASPPIRVTTRLVQVNVLVHDHHGNAVSDLTKQDFEISDNGKPQQIAVFTLESSNAGGAGSSAQPGIMPRNVVTNRPERRPGVPSSVTVLLLDTYNTKLTDQMYARREMIKFLRQIRPDDYVALYLLGGGGFSVVHDFTNSAESLLAALARVLPGFSNDLDASEPDLSNTGDDSMDAIMDASNTVVASFFTRNRVINTCLAFKVLADHLAGVPGRKNVIWVSGGFPTTFGFGDSQDTTDQSSVKAASSIPSPDDREIYTDYIEDASYAMCAANAAVYPVDARGLMGLPFADASKRIKLNPNTHQLPSSMTHVNHDNTDTMDYIASLTGGKAFYNTNDIRRAIRDAIDDSAVSYTLGYYASGDDWDNRFHKIKVKVDRSGVLVRTQKGYFAKDQATPTPARLNQVLSEAVWSPLDSTTLGVTARIDPSPALPNASRVVFKLDPAEFQFQETDSKYHGSIDVVFVQQTKRGKRVADSKKTIEINLSPDRFAQMKAKGLLAEEDLKLVSDTDAIRVVILDRATGRTGAVTLPVTAQDKSGAAVPPAPAH